MTSWLLRSTAGRVLASAAAVLVVGTIAGLVLLWPGETGDAGLAEGLTTPSVGADVTSVQAVPCRNPEADRCRLVEFRLRAGPDRDQVSRLATGESESDPELAVGDRIRVAANEVPEGADPVSVDPYAFTDFERRGTMVWLLLAFAVLVVAVGRWRGARSLLGLAVSLAVVVGFVVPAILDGGAPLAVAVAGGLAIMLATLTLAHGLGPKTLAAALGTGASLLLTAGLAVAFTEVAHLSGASSEEATLLQAGGAALSLEGLVVAGMVIGALGVLDDVTVSQASTVMALRRANPTLGLRELYRAALEVGRDHVAATVNTLVLAYAGASLPILLVFSVGDTAFADAVNREAVAEEIVATLVGSVGLIAAVPVTTALAALLAVRAPAEALGDTHAHAH